jgi:tetratricopeptide (TPR) repeat protein
MFKGSLTGAFFFPRQLNQFKTELRMIKKLSSTQVKFNALLKLVEKDLSTNNLHGAIKSLNLLIEIEPANHAAISELGTCYAKLNNFSRALEFHEKALSLNPENMVIMTNVGLDLMHLGRFGSAKSYFEKVLSLNITDANAHLGLCNLYNNQGDYQNLIRVCTDGLSYFPNNEQLHIFVACGLLGINKFSEAKYSLETALLLNSNSLEAKFNLAHIESHIGSSKKSISLYQELLELPLIKNNDLYPLINFNLSFEFLKNGFLEKGWDLYENGFDYRIPFHMRRRPNRTFKVPKWNGQPLVKSRILVWREQGIGDELLFLSILNDLIEIAFEVILECEPRLVNICQKSFPKILVRPASTGDDNIPSNEDYDFEISIGSLAKFFRRSINSFRPNEIYLKPDREFSNSLINIISSTKDTLKIGICWRSGILNTQRNTNYLPLIDWGVIFDLPNCMFVNLQYGECENELIEVEQKNNIIILRDNNINLKDDLDTVFSIISNLDLVISPATAVSAMSFAIGTTTLIFKKNNSWDILGQNYYPWSSSAKIFPITENYSSADTLNEIAKYISENFQS